MAPMVWQSRVRWDSLEMMVFSWGCVYDELGKVQYCTANFKERGVLAGCKLVSLALIFFYYFPSLNPESRKEGVRVGGVQSRYVVMCWVNMGI